MATASPNRSAAIAVVAHRDILIPPPSSSLLLFHPRFCSSTPHLYHTHLPTMVRRRSAATRPHAVPP